MTKELLEQLALDLESVVSPEPSLMNGGYQDDPALTAPVTLRRNAWRHGYASGCRAAAKMIRSLIYPEDHFPKMDTKV